MARKPQPRRGVLLLIVLSLLVLFLLVGITFIVIAGQYRRAAVQVARVERYGDPPRVLMDLAIHQILADTRNVRSAAIGHSLLRDLYGSDGFVGEVETATILPNQQFLRVGIANAQRGTGFYNGGILTFTSGPVTGKSFRIVRFSNDTVTGEVLLEIPSGISTSQIQSLIQLNNPADPFRFVVNGRPFNGTGAGFDRSIGNLDQMVTISGLNVPTAVLPNYSAYAVSLADPVWNGGMDESYDIADYQNMALAWVPADSERQTQPSPSHLIPSFHRPALAYYWWNQAPDNPEVMRAAVLRPWLDHPKFDGGNPDFDPFVGPWDVDNDGNGIPDSVWIDLGLPVQQSPSGRTYKPLFAVLCVDLDGRLNLNAHGNLHQWENGSSLYDAVSAVVGLAGNTGNPLAGEPRGDGYGPAEIYLGAGCADPSEFEQLLHGRYAPLHTPEPEPRPGRFNFDDDVLFDFRHFAHPDNYFGQISGYSNPPDLRGVGLTAVDHTGQPMVGISGYPGSNGEAVELRKDDPYEINLVQPAAHDLLYTDHDLEWLLRPYDVDQSSYGLNGEPPRLLAQAPATFDFTISPASLSGYLFTTRSFEVPVAPLQVPSTDPTNELRRNVPVAPDLIDLVKARMEQNGTLIDRSNSADLQKLQQMLPFELLQGQKMDLNRPLGSGFDDDGNNIVDEPAERDDVTYSDLLNDQGKVLEPAASVPNPTPAPLRQMFARHLYCLAMMLKNDAAVVDTDGDPANNGPRETAFAVAQWAINVVDFRDPDSIMTPFEFDIDPFNGWDVNGNVNDDDGTHRGLVWGCERPELLITETLAWHDRRTEDLDTDEPDVLEPGDNSTEPVSTTGGDVSFDQRHRPQGAFFVELYNPWTGATDKKPWELYAVDGSGVDLQKREPQQLSPVWRLMVTKDVPVNPHNDERFVYFVDANTLPNQLLGGPEGSVFATNQPIVGSVIPGRYAVIGSSGYEIPADANDPTRYISVAGRRTFWNENPDNKLDETRRVELRPVGGYQNVPCVMPPPVPFTDPNLIGNPQLAWRSVLSQPIGNAIQPFSAAAINRVYRAGGWEPSSLTISEPLEGYGMDINEVLPQPEDVPLDDPADLWTEHKTHDAIGDPGHRMVHLQRLADPTIAYNPMFGEVGHDVAKPVNPYVTIDSSYVDLTVFNGISEDEVDFLGNEDDIRFQANQRGDHQVVNQVVHPNPRRALWKFEPPPPLSDLFNRRSAKETDVGAEKHRFAFLLRSSLGYLNDEYRPAFPSGPYRGAPDTISPLGPGQDPAPAFPWLTWNNRPYVSELELLNVPRSSPDRLLKDFQVSATPHFAGYSFYFSSVPNTDVTTGLGATPFNHMWNFLGDQSVAGAASAALDGSGLGLSRLLDFVHVPSRFIGTEKWYNRSRFTGSFGDAAATSFRPPFNRLSRFRDPGQVNLNTIPDAAVWQGIAAAFPDYATFAPIDSRWASVEKSLRHADFDPSIPGSHLQSGYPTQFTNPFRSAASHDLAPFVPDLNGGTENKLRRHRATAAGLLREHPDPAFSGFPLFSIPSDFDGTNRPHRDTGRNPYFHLKPIQRLANLTTHQSNVYAVWITVGYFEVESQSPPDPDTYPDGYALGQELNSDTGQIERHRAFYIIDRSIPVGFEPGEKHNVDEAIVLERFIE